MVLEQLKQKYRTFSYNSKMKAKVNSICDKAILRIENMSEGFDDSGSFGYQWKNFDSSSITYTENRVNELLDQTGLPKGFFEGKLCLDAGSGNGRLTYAMMQLGADVISIDSEPEAVRLCSLINPNTRLVDIEDGIFTSNGERFDFILCWGVLHHLSNPEIGFINLASSLKKGGMLHLMVYNKKGQSLYEIVRGYWRFLTISSRLWLCEQLSKEIGGVPLDWWDSANPKFNWSYKPQQVRKWFSKNRFKDITLIKEFNINMRGVR